MFGRRRPARNTKRPITSGNGGTAGVGKEDHLLLEEAELKEGRRQQEKTEEEGRVTVGEEPKRDGR